MLNLNPVKSDFDFLDKISPALNIDQKSATDGNSKIKSEDFKTPPQNPARSTGVEEPIEIVEDVVQEEEAEEEEEEQENYEDDDFPQHEPMYQPEDPGQIDQSDESVERGHDEL